MELLSIEIINFGKISNLKLDIKKGLNSYIFENGWGKTTLVTFIKSMFYGIEHPTANSKDINKYDFLKYNPWQGGVFGGSLEFEHNGKQYKISRTFGAKAKDDTFELRDLKTNLLSDDFSSNLGNELFGVSRETYERSVHISLNEMPSLSDDISAKLNNLVEAGDIGNFENASKALDDKIKFIKNGRSKGRLSDIDTQIEKKNSDLITIDTKLKQNKEYEYRIDNLKKEISEIEENQKKLTEQISQNAKYESKIRYEQLKDDLQKALDSKEQIEDFFNGNIPDERTLSNITEISSDFTTVDSNIKTQSATQSEKDDYDSLKNYFAGDVPTQEQMSDCLKIDTDYKKFKQQESEKKLSSQELNEFETLKIKFDDKNISNDLINEKLNLYSTVQSPSENEDALLKQKGDKENELKIMQFVKPRNTKRNICFILGIISLLVSLVFLFALKMMIPCVAAGAVFVLAIVVGFLFKAPNADNSSLLEEIASLNMQIENIKAQKNKSLEEVDFFVKSINPSFSANAIVFNQISVEFNRYEILKNKNEEYLSWIKSQTVTPQEYENKLLTFLKRYCKTENILNVPGDIQTLNSKVTRLKELDKKINADSFNTQKKGELSEKLTNILNQYKTDKTLSYKDQVQEIFEKNSDLKNAQRILLEAQQKIKDFENDPKNDIDSFAELNAPKKSTNELEESLSLLNGEMNSKKGEISNYSNRLNENLAETEKKDDFEMEISVLKEEKEERLVEYKLYNKTKDLLLKARENLDANYSDPMKDGFDKYVKMLGGKLNLIIDTTLKVSVDESGQTHSCEYLSEGYKDMVNFCTRMALIDSLFKEVKPPIVLDDPFVNLDDDKVPNALDLVKKMADENQILYFTCHESRGI